MVASGWVNPMKSIITKMKNAGNSAVNVSIFESSSPHKCINIAAIIINFGSPIPTKMNKGNSFSV